MTSKSNGRFKEEVPVIQNLISKIASVRIFENLSRKASNKGLTHTQISRKAGKFDNVFNRDLNNVSRLYIDTFFRYMYAINELVPEEKIQMDELMDSEVYAMLDLISRMTDMSDLAYLEDNDIEFLIRIKYYIDKLKKKDKITEKEVAIYEKAIRR